MPKMLHTALNNPSNHGWSRCRALFLLGLTLCIAYFLTGRAWAQNTSSPSDTVRFNPGPAITANYTSSFEQLERGELAVDFLLTDLDGTVKIHIDGAPQSFLARSVVVLRKIYNVRGKVVTVKVEAEDSKGKKSVRTFRFEPKLLAKATFKNLSDSIIGGKSTTGNVVLIMSGMGLIAAGRAVGTTAKEDFQGTVRSPASPVDRNKRVRDTLLANGLIFTGALLATVATWRLFGGEDDSSVESVQRDNRAPKQQVKNTVILPSQPTHGHLRVGLTQIDSHLALGVGFFW